MARNDKRRFGDRKDGRLIRSLPGFARFIPYIMPSRNDATNLYEERMEVSAVDRRLRRLRVEGYKGIGILHFLIAAYIRLVSMLPGLNRFVAGRHLCRKRHRRGHGGQALPVRRRERDHHQDPLRPHGHHL